MTAPLSTGNSLLRRYYFYRLCGMKSRFIALCIMALFSFPLIAVCVDILLGIDVEGLRGPVYPETQTEMNARHAITSGMAALIAFGGIFMALVMFLQGHLTAKESFRYLYDKKYADIDMSLPTDANTRFFGDCLAGLTVYIVPVAAGVILAQLLLIPGHALNDEFRRLAESIPNSPYISAPTDAFLTHAQYGSIAMLLGCVMQYFFSLMTVSFCGRRLTANLVPAIFNIAATLTIYLFCIIVGACAYGMYAGTYIGGSSGNEISDFTPLGMLIGIFTRDIETLKVMLCGALELKCLLASAAFGTAAYFMLKHRRAERTGSAFVYKGGRYATELMIMLCSASAVYLSLLNDDRISRTLIGISSVLYSILKMPQNVLIAAWIAVNLIIFVIIELVSREKLKKPLRLLYAAGRFVISAGLSFLVCFALASCDGFGAAGYVPAVDDIAYISITGYIPGMTSIDHYAYLTDTAAFEQVTRLHERIVTERPKGSDTALLPGYDGEVYYWFGAGTTVHIDVSYTLKTGEIVSRSYVLPTEYARDFISFWFGSGAFASDYRIPDPEDMDNAEIWLPTRSETTHQTEMKLSDIPYDEFRNAIMTDAGNATVESIFLTGGTDCAAVQLKSGDSIWFLTLWSTFDNTVNLLRKYNYDPFAGRLDNAVGYYIYKQTSIGSFSPDTVTDYGINENGIPYETRDIEYREITGEQAKELLAHSATQTVYENSRDVYFIRVVRELIKPENNGTFRSSDVGAAVLEEYCDRAAEIYEISPATDNNTAHGLSYGMFDDSEQPEYAEVIE